MTEAPSSLLENNVLMGDLNISQNIILSATSLDGRKRWQLYRRPDGLFEYREFTRDDEIYWVEEDGSETDVAAPVTWLPSTVSGFFDTAEATRNDALSSLPWLSVALPTTP
jgi:hypothetical protein